MKKSIIVLFVIIFIFIIFFSANIPTASAENSGDFIYTVNSGQATITGYTGNGGAVTVPSTIDGYPVIALGPSIFADNINLTSVSIPIGVTNIGDYVFSLCRNLTKVTIPASVAYIGESAFSNCNSLASILLPEGIKRIERSTFYSCNSLKTIIVPNSVTDIDEWAFASCASLTNVVLGSNVSSIDDWAFRYSNGLTSITLPQNTSSLGEHTFSECYSLAHIYVDADNPFFYSQDGILLNKSKTSLVRYPQANPATTYTVPSGITEIAESAFFCSQNLTNVTIPSSVTQIGRHAFRECHVLTNISLSSAISQIGEGAFCNCTNLTSIHVDEQNAFFKSQDGILFNKAADKILQYPAGKTETSYTIPEGVTEIGAYCFNGTEKIRYVTLPYGVNEVGDCAFDGCTYLLSIELPNSVSVIGENAFNFCISLNGVNIPEGITRIESGTFGATVITSIRLPQSLISIGSGAFANCEHLTQIKIPSNVTDIEFWAFGSAGLEAVYFYGDAPSLGQLVFSNAQDSLTIYYSNDKSGYSDTMEGFNTVGVPPDQMPAFDETGFSGVSGDYTFWVNNGKATIIEYTGSDSYLNIPSKLNGYPVESIGPRAFYNNTAITNVTIPYGIEKIGVHAFYNTGIRSISIPNSVTQINTQAFLSCVNLQSVSLPIGLKEISDSLFYYCPSLSSVSIPDTVTHINSCAFAYCGMESVTIPKSVTHIGTSAFAGNPWLKKAYFEGDAPTQEDPHHYIEGDEGLFDNCHEDFIIYYTVDASGFTNPWNGYPTQSYDPNSLISSSVYSIDRSNGLLRGIALNTSVSKLKSNLKNDTADIKVFTGSGDEYTGSYIATGMKIRLINNNTVSDELTTIISGDVNGDGSISITDYTLARLDILGLKSLDQIPKAAADINMDGVVSITDYTLIRLDILGLKKIH